MRRRKKPPPPTPLVSYWAGQLASVKKVQDSLRAGRRPHTFPPSLIDNTLDEYRNQRRAVYDR